MLGNNHFVFHSQTVPLQREQKAWTYTREMVGKSDLTSMVLIRGAPACIAHELWQVPCRACLLEGRDIVFLTSAGIDGVHHPKWKGCPVLIVLLLKFAASPQAGSMI
jgi:hypothetical protein